MGRIGWLAGIATAIAVVLCVWFIGGWGGPAALQWGCNVGCLAFAVFATACAGLAASRSTGRKRLAWGCVGLGVAGWAAGSALWMYYVRAVDEPPFPSLADAGYLLFPIAICAGLVVYPTGRRGHSRSRVLLDGLIFVAALFQVSWLTVLRDVYDAGGTTRFAFALSLAYPLADIVVITVAVLVIMQARMGQRRALVLLATGVVLMALSDSAFVYLSARDEYRGGSVADVGWIAGLLVIGIAALTALGETSSETATVRVPSRLALCLPYIPTAVAIAVCTPPVMRTPGMSALFVSTALLVIAAMARQYFVVAENRRLLEVVAEQAMRDPLTGLANRALFNDRLTHAIQLHQRDRQPVAVLCLDLDDFKLVNDNLGHLAGDALLALVAERIHACVRTGDTVARLGGDEFAVVMEGKAEHSRLVAHRIMTAFDEMFLVDGHDLLLRPSVGLAVSTADDDDLTANALLKRADVAMYSAKRSRTGGVHTFDPEMHRIELAESDPTGQMIGGRARRNGVGAVRTLGQLRHAIDHAELTLRYQPKFALRDGALVGVEALVRWPHPERGLLSPDQFLPLVREHGLMRSVTDLVVRQALDDAAQWQASGFSVPVAVNMFAPSLCDLTLPDRILAELDARALRPDVLTIEITEDLLLDNFDRTREVLDRMRAHGMRVAIDDFGSGYSTLGYLCELPIDEVKLDRQFIAPILVDTRAAAVVRAVVDLADVLGMTTVAEGVENAATAAVLRDYGCDVAQGFHYSQPVSAAQLGELLPGTTARVPVSTRSS